MRAVPKAFLATILAISGTVLADEPAASGAVDRFCENRAELAKVSAKFPDHVLAWQADTRASLLSRPAFDPSGLLRSAQGSPVCYAIVLDETGAPQDARVFYPRPLRFSRSERSDVLSGKFTPSINGSQPVKSIVIVKMEMN